MAQRPYHMPQPGNRLGLGVMNKGPLMNLIESLTAHGTRRRHYRSTPKRVGLDLRVTVKLTDKVAYCCRCHSEVAPDWGPVLEGLPYRTKVYYYDGCSITRRDCSTHGESDHVTHIHAHFWVPAEDDKPRLIPSESQAMALIAFKTAIGNNYNHTLEEILSARIQSVMDKWQTLIEASEVSKQANLLIRHVCAQARQETYEATDFKSKMKTLVDEFMAHQQATLDRMAADLETCCADDDSEETWTPRAIELAKSRASAALYAPTRRYTTIFTGILNDFVTPEDVLAGDAAKKTEKLLSTT